MRLILAYRLMPLMVGNEKQIFIKNSGEAA